VRLNGQKPLPAAFPRELRTLGDTLPTDYRSEDCRCWR